MTWLAVSSPAAALRI